MRKRLLLAAVLAAVISGLGALPAVAGSGPSGEVLHGGNGANGGQVIEPAINDANGSLVYLSTPRGVANPVNSNPKATAPLYLVVYPKGSLDNSVTLNCLDFPSENCPDHGPAVAQGAAAFDPAVYGPPDGSGVLGHDHLIAVPGGHGDFNVAWVPTLVLFKPGVPITHIKLLSQINTTDFIIVPLDGNHGPPNATFHCAVVPASIYNNSIPYVLGG
jgi:hypothetical protein